MTNMNVCVCGTCYFHLVEYLGNKTKESTTKKQQLNNKNKSREKIYFREQRTNQCQHNTKESKMRSAVLPARATTLKRKKH